MEEHHFKFPKTVHYYSLGQATRTVRHFWIVCHGYGQLASKFLRRFAALEGEDTFVIAPEGMSRFYWGGFDGPVVASWMTRKDRLDEIDDYCNFIQHLYDHYLPLLHPEVQIHLLGFSQGTATQCRWIHARQPHFHSLTLWAGLLTDDLDFRPLQSYFADKKLLWVYGTEDQFLTPSRLQWQLDFAEKNLLNFQTLTFEGKHEVEEAPLLRLKKLLKNQEL